MANRGFWRELLRRNVLRAATALAAQRAPAGAWHRIALTLALQIAPDRAAADSALTDPIDKDADQSSWQLAKVYALRRSPDNMFKWLDQAWANREGGFACLLFDFFILRCQSDPRSAAFAKGVGLPSTTDAKALS